MLTLSAKSVYGVHALFELARSFGKRAVKIKEIAVSQGIPEDYLRQLLIVLKRAGLVNSVRGTQGGYTLARPPSSIKVGEIIEVLEGHLKPVNVVVKERTLSFYWRGITKEVEKIFDTSLEELVLERQKLDQNITYYI